MKRSLTLVATAVGALAVAVIWAHWRGGITQIHRGTGKIMARARNCDREFFYEIVVREIKSEPLGPFVPADSACYQCEFHKPGPARPWSYQSYSGDSFTASRAEVVWTNEHEATVLLDDTPVLKCVDGWWTRP